MKVVMLKDVKGVGRMHEVVTTADGHALNYLIPGHFAISATLSAIKSADDRRKKHVFARDVQSQLILQNIARLAEARVVIKMKANEKGHLYDAVGESEILLAVKQEAGVDLPEGIIRLDKSIKEIGTYDIPVSHGEQFGKFSLTVEAE